MSAIRLDDFLRLGLLLAATAATATISIRDPRAGWIFESAALVLAAIAIWRRERAPLRLVVPLAAIGLWGFAQLALGATVYRFATLDSSLRMASLAAIAVAAGSAFQTARATGKLIAWMAGFGLAVASLGVLAQFTSPGKYLWMFPSPYPDSWGVFASRNNFAQFLELALPAALWRARTGSVFDMAAAGAMLAAGVASASRAGAALLAFETIACLALMGRGKLKKWKLAAVIAASVAVGGAGQLVGRFRQPDPLELRREIARSTLAMIRAHPLKGWGLGTFASVYPAYAEFDIGAAVEHAHDDWLEWTAEGGIGFAAAWAALAISIGVPAVRSIWGMGVLAVLAHAIVDFPFARLGIAAWVFLLIGALAARGGVREFARGEH